MNKKYKSKIDPGFEISFAPDNHREILIFTVDIDGNQLCRSEKIPKHIDYPVRIDRIGEAYDLLLEYHEKIPIPNYWMDYFEEQPKKCLIASAKKFFKEKKIDCSCGEIEMAFRANSDYLPYHMLSSFDDNTY